MKQLNTVADFLENRRFRLWLKKPDAAGTLYWDNWLKENPSKKDLFENALAAYLALEGGSTEMSDLDVADRVMKIKENLPPEPAKNAWWRRSEIAWAAMLLATLGAGWLFWLRESGNVLVSDIEKTISAAEVQKNDLVIVKNTKDKPLLVNLPDRSSVILTSNSQLEYVNNEASFRREVTLKGEAFFEIVKNPGKPFYVHTVSLTTKVLGTSFLVRSFEGESRATVRVRTGKVEVTPGAAEMLNTMKSNNPERLTAPNAVLLLPNQQASLVHKTNILIRDKELTKQTEDQPTLFNLRKFQFKFTPVAEIFDMLEKTYGTKITYDAETFRNCTLTANLTDEPFLEKLRLICISTEASFEVVGSGIVVSGAGCK